MSSNPYESPPAVTEEYRTLPPIKVKLYGLIPVTKNGYLAIQTVLCVTACGGLYAVQPIVARPGSRFGFLKDHLIIILLVALAWGGIEVFVMLKKFKQAELARTQENSDE